MTATASSARRPSQAAAPAQNPIVTPGPVVPPAGRSAAFRVSPVLLSIVVTTAETSPSPETGVTTHRTFVRSFRRSSESRPSSRKTVESCSFSYAARSGSRSAIGRERFPAS